MSLLFLLVCLVCQRKQWHPTPVLSHGKSHGWRSLVGYSPWGRWVKHNWMTSLSLFTFTHWRRKWQPTPMFLPGESQGRGAWWAAIYGVAESWTWLKRLSSNSSLVCMSVQYSHSVVSDYLRPHEPQHARPPCPSPTPGVHPNPCPLNQWCHPTISSSVFPFSSCPQSFPVSGSFPMSQLFSSGGQSIGVLVSASVLPINTQDWSPLRWTGWISLQSKGLSRVFSNTTVQKHQFFSIQLSL